MGGGEDPTYLLSTDYVCAQQFAVQSDLIVLTTLCSQVALFASPDQLRGCILLIACIAVHRTALSGDVPSLPCAWYSAWLCEPLKKGLTHDDGMSRPSFSWKGNRPREHRPVPSTILPGQDRAPPCLLGQRTRVQPGIPGAARWCPREVRAAQSNFQPALVALDQPRKKRVL